MAAENHRRDARRRSRSRRSYALSVSVLFLLLATVHDVARGHTLPYFSWFEIQRQAVVGSKEVRVTHTCRFDPRSFRAGDPLVDSDGDTTASQHEVADLCALSARYLAQDFLALSFDQPLPASLDSFAMLEGNSGFRTELVIPLPAGGGRLPLSLLDPVYLLPRPAGFTDAESSGSLLRTTEAGVTLLDPAGHGVRSLQFPPAFRTELTVERPASTPSSPAPVSLLSGPLPSEPAKGPVEEIHP